MSYPYIPAKIFIPYGYVALDEVLQALLRADSIKNSDINRKRLTTTLGNRLDYWEQLVKILAKGKIKSVLLGRHGTVYKIDAAAWKPGGWAIIDERGQRHQPPRGESGYSIRSPDGLTFGQVAVSTVEMSRFFRIDSTSPGGSEARGAKRTYDRELFLHVAYRVAWKRDGKFASQEAFLDEALSDFAVKTTSEISPDGQTPSVEWARPLIRAIWSNLSLSKQHPNSY